MILTHPPAVLVGQGPSCRGGRRSRSRGRSRMGRVDGGDRSQSAGQRDGHRRSAFGRIGDLARPLRHNQWMQRWHGRIGGVCRAGVNRSQRNRRRRHKSKRIVLVHRRLMRRMISRDLDPLIGGEAVILMSGTILLHLHCRRVHRDVLHQSLGLGLRSLSIADSNFQGKQAADNNGWLSRLVSFPPQAPVPGKLACASNVFQRQSACTMSWQVLRTRNAELKLDAGLPPGMLTTWYRVQYSMYCTKSDKTGQDRHKYH